jgi:transposase
MAINLQPDTYSKIWFSKDNPIIKYKFKHSLKINVWGCILKDKLIVHIYDGILNGIKYVNILDEHIIPLIKNTKKQLLFQQDNAPFHVSTIVRNFFIKNKVEVMFWPANSPDLNPIENVWHLIKHKIGKIKINTKAELIKILKKIVKEFDIQIINNLIKTMDNRINSLFDNNFGSINY